MNYLYKIFFLSLLSFPVLASTPEQIKLNCQDAYYVGHTVTKNILEEGATEVDILESLSLMENQTLAKYGKIALHETKFYNNKNNTQDEFIINLIAMNNGSLSQIACLEDNLK